MTMKATFDDVGKEVKAAVDKATIAYDGLIAELKNGKPDSTVVLGRSGEIWTASLKAWANLILAPSKIAETIANDGKP